MAITTCPECGQNPVSDRAASCPRCGCPIATGVSPPSEAAGQPLSILEQRMAQLPSGANLNGSSGNPDVSVVVDLGEVNLREVVGTIEGWCEELVVRNVQSHLVNTLGRLPRLKSLEINSGELNDEVLLQISKIETLEKLEILNVKGWATSEQGWLRLTRLPRLEYLWVDTFFRGELMFDDEVFERDEAIREEIRRRMPDTIIRS